MTAVNLRLAALYYTMYVPGGLWRNKRLPYHIYAYLDFAMLFNTG